MLIIFIRNYNSIDIFYIQLNDMFSKRET